MDEKQLWLQAEALERQIALLPAGPIAKKCKWQRTFLS